jgi:signal peptidase I
MSTPIDAPAARRRSVIAAALLSLLVSGLGQIYVGRAQRGLIVFALVMTSYAIGILCVTGLLPRFPIFVAAAALSVGLFVYAIVDAAIAAWRTHDYTPRRYNRWFVYLGAVIAGWAIIVGIGSTRDYARAAGFTGYFNVPSASMEPTLRLGEYILADTLWYKTHVPRRGDLAVYALPRQPDTLYIKRIAALPGDRIAVKDGRAIINGTRIDEPFAMFGDPNAFANSMAEVTVPPGHLFMLGDNRANSNDSRSAATHGMVPIPNLRARVTDIVFSRDLSRIGRVADPVR